MTIPFQSESQRAFITHPEKFDAAAMLREPRLHLFERATHPCLKIERMQSMQEEQIRNERIFPELINQRLSIAPAFINDLERAIQPIPVQFK